MAGLRRRRSPAGLVGAMLQDAGLMPGVRVGELLAMVRGLYPRPLPLGELVGLAGLGSLLGRRADRLSGGQAQRVRFAAAIAGDPLLLVLDEPTAAMDVHARRNFWRQIHGFAGRGRTVLFATHYLHEADDAADRVVVIAAGRKIADGPPAAIKANFGDQQVRFTLLRGSPALLAALDGVRAVEQDHSRITLHSSDTDATVTLAGGQRAAVVRPGGRRARPGDIVPAAAGRRLMTGFLALELRRSLRDVRYLIIAVAHADRAVPAVHRPVRLARPARPGTAPAGGADGGHGRLRRDVGRLLGHRPPDRP